MTTGTYGYTTAGWCGNCGRRRGPDGRCPNCDPWWTSPIFQIGGPIALLVTLGLIIGISVFKGNQDSGPRIAATRVNSQIGATRIPSTATAPSYSPTYISRSMVVSAGSSANIAPPPRPEVVQLQQLQELRRMTAYVDGVVQSDQNMRAQQARFASTYILPRGRASVEMSASAAAPSAR